ncbi:SMP-30/gluconolactonase/LRE family protein [Thalassotalea profundi]|uniref:Gluconolactonase n=1 Tax=Thalassotalea profundi TaxID=2036687 RepID=A0ABQ3J125_9GAMM|nr:SMP-30/gluconolactonase/LRE family protein [Thalassotalea profundi]GHE99024.1 gluconolactonase [Thalassotalea profundi]
MFKIFTLFLLFTIASQVACATDTPLKQRDLYQSEDWVGDGTFTSGIEGPAVAKNGDLFVVNYREQGTIGRVIDKNQVVLLVKLSNGSIGNGIRFDESGNMYIADYVNHNVLTINNKDLISNQLESHQLKTDSVKVYAHSSMMNQPNDIAIMDNGIIFASDPNWAKNTGQLWRVNKEGKARLLVKEMGTTNGIEVSPDNKTLYVNESVQRNVWRYRLANDGSISDKRLLIHFDDFGLDGMRTDQQGNLYIARYGKGVIAIVSPKGKLIREVTLKGKFPTNVAFGGVDGKTVFVTMQKRGAIEKFNAEYSGRIFKNLN